MPRMKGICQYCGKESGNVSVHEPACEKNPNRPKRKSLVEETREMELVDSDILTKTEPVTKEEPKEPTEPKKPQSPLLIIKDVQEIDCPDDLKAVYQGKDGKITAYTPRFRGIWVRENMEVPTLLVTAADGSLLPPSLIGDFLGMFSESVIEAAKETQKPTEVQPDTTESFLTSQEILLHHNPEEKEVVREVQQPKPEPQPEPKPELQPLSIGASSKSILERILARKKTA